MPQVKKTELDALLDAGEMLAHFAYRQSRLKGETPAVVREARQLKKAWDRAVLSLTEQEEANAPGS